MKEISEKEKIACLLSVLPILMDYMEDIKYAQPGLYSKQVKRSGNQFIIEVEKLTDKVYKSVQSHPETDEKEFAQTVIDMGGLFEEFIQKISR
jgi:hypothetical protein